MPLSDKAFASFALHDFSKFLGYYLNVDKNYRFILYFKLNSILKRKIFNAIYELIFYAR